MRQSTNHGRWFRFYAKAIDDPKVQTLPGDLFKTWVNLLCIASGGVGELPTISDIAFRLRLSEKDAGKRLSSLVAARLLDETPTGLVPHDWDEMQFRADGSVERMRRFRKRHRTAKAASASATSDVTSDVTGDEIGDG